jgi:hypothetical protein
VVLSYEWAGGQESGSRRRLEHEVKSTVTGWDREGDQRDGREKERRENGWAASEW